MKDGKKAGGFDWVEESWWLMPAVHAAVSWGGLALVGPIARASRAVAAFVHRPEFMWPFVFIVVGTALLLPAAVAAQIERKQWKKAFLAVVYSIGALAPLGFVCWLAYELRDFGTIAH